MHVDERLSAVEREIESSLTVLRPAGPALGRDAMLFHAGQASARGYCRWWQGASGTLAVCLVVALIVRPAAPALQTTPFPTGAVTALIAKAGPALPPPIDAESSRLAYLSMRDDILAHGLDAMPGSHVSFAMTHEPLPQVKRLGTPAQPSYGVTPLDTLNALLNPGVGT